MAAISFLAGLVNNIGDIAGSGLGFYGPGGFGTSVETGEYQDNTYVTDSTGASNGPKAQNVKYVHPLSGMVPTADTRLLREIPNQLATLNIRFTHTSAVKTQNVKLRIFDRVNIDAPASGVTCKVAQLIHPWNTQTPAGSGATSWSTPGGSGGIINGFTYDAPVSLVSSPGTSGWSPSGTNTADTQHDWYVAISASADTIGSKTQFGLYVSLEYL
jgi:hypothetical protein